MFNSVQGCLYSTVTQINEHSDFIHTLYKFKTQITKTCVVFFGNTITNVVYDRLSGAISRSATQVTIRKLTRLSIVGGNIPIVAGMALAFKLRGEKRVAVSFFGDGASNEGAFHEGLNAAAIYELPAVFVCENNLYGASTSIKRTMKLKDIADRAAAYGMTGAIGDGMNVFAVYAQAEKAVARARKGKGPTLLELKTFRLCGHSRRDPNNYMTEEEKTYWKEKDPIPACEKMLKDVGYLNDELREQIHNEVEEQVDKAIEFGQTSPDPKPEDTYKGLYINSEAPR